MVNLGQGVGGGSLGRELLDELRGTEIGKRKSLGMASLWLLTLSFQVTVWKASSK